ncbi:hypothetical protein FRC06_009865, partial [Ceratobasidium sp. 370]
MTEDRATSPPADLGPRSEIVSTVIAPQPAAGAPQPNTVAPRSSPNPLNPLLSDDASLVSPCTAVEETVVTPVERISEVGHQAGGIRNTTLDQTLSEESPCAEHIREGTGETHNGPVTPLIPEGAPFTTIDRLSTPPPEIVPAREPPPTYSASPLSPNVVDPPVPPAIPTPGIVETSQNRDFDNAPIHVNLAGPRPHNGQMREGASRSHDTPLMSQPNTVGAPHSRTQIMAGPNPTALLSTTQTVVYAGWGGLQRVAQVLKQSGMNTFAPLKLAIHDVSACIDIFERATVNQQEYASLRTQLDSLLHDLARYLGGSTPPTITPSIENLAKGIHQEIAHIREKESRPRTSRYAEANEDIDEVLMCYQRIKGLLERLVVNMLGLNMFTVLKYSQMNSNINIWRIVDEQATSSRLWRMCPSQAAWYCSAESASLRDSCTPNTRVAVLQQLRAWTQDSASKKVYWLNGMAGTGKTTIAYTLCEQLDEERRLAACFFCSRQLPDCSNVNSIWPTLAYQLARFSPPFRHSLSRTLERNPDVHTHRLRRQFRELIDGPLLVVQNSIPQNLVVVIDGLDECSNNDGGEILSILFSWGKLLPIKFLVTSRPEPGIVGSRLPFGGGVVCDELHLHELEDSVVQADIKAYLRVGLVGVGLALADIDRLAERSGALFIYAAAAMRYILADNGARSAKRLKMVLDTPNSSPSNVNKHIDTLYTMVLQSAFYSRNLEDDDRREMTLVLRTVI